MDWERTPGAAQRSSRTLLFSRKPYFLLSWISLKAARALYPFSFASLYHLSRRPFPCFFWIAMMEDIRCESDPRSEVVWRERRCLKR